MKLVLITSSFSGGGITSYAHEVVKACSKFYDITVIIGDDSQSPFVHTKVYHCDADDLSLSNASYLIDLINNQIKPDIILNSNAAIMSLVSPYVDNSIRIISVSHSLKYQEADVAGYNSQYIDGIIALSCYNEAYLRTAFKIKESNKIKVIYNFVESLDNYQNLISQKQRTRTLTIVYAGGTAPSKSPEIVYKVLKSLLKSSLDFKFYFLGTLTPPLKSLQPFDSIQQLFQSDPRLIFTGKVSREDANDIIKSANVLFIPSRREGCPITMLEAMRAGAIVITSDYENACREMVVPGENGFIIPHSKITDFVDQIIDIIENHNQYVSMYEKSVRIFAENYSYEVWEKNMSDFLNSGESLHKNRKTSLNHASYLYRRFKFSLRMSYDKWHALAAEYLYPALYFCAIYFKQKRNQNEYSK